MFWKISHNACIYNILSWCWYWTNYFSDTYRKVNDECKFHWSQLQTDFLDEYIVEPIFPIHLQPIALPFFLVHVFIWLTVYCCFKIKRRLNKIQHRDTHDSSNSYERDKSKKYPMFVRGKNLKNADTIKIIYLSTETFVQRKTNYLSDNVHTRPYRHKSQIWKLVLCSIKMTLNETFWI